MLRESIERATERTNWSVSPVAAKRIPVFVRILLTSFDRIRRLPGAAGHNHFSLLMTNQWR